MLDNYSNLFLCTLFSVESISSESLAVEFNYVSIGLFETITFEFQFRETESIFSEVNDPQQEFSEAFLDAIVDAPNLPIIGG